MLQSKTHEVFSIELNFRESDLPSTTKTWSEARRGKDRLKYTGIFLLE